jgi:hypothetical protein
MKVLFSIILLIFISGQFSAQELLYTDVFKSDKGNKKKLKNNWSLLGLDVKFSKINQPNSSGWEFAIGQGDWSNIVGEIIVPLKEYDRLKLKIVLSRNLEDSEIINSFIDFFEAEMFYVFTPPIDKLKKTATGTYELELISRGKENYVVLDLINLTSEIVVKEVSLVKTVDENTDELIKNGSFELSYLCETRADYIPTNLPYWNDKMILRESMTYEDSLMIGVGNEINWTWGSIDLFSKCSQYLIKGHEFQIENVSDLERNNYMAFNILGKRFNKVQRGAEYLYQKLENPLDSAKTYNLSFYVRQNKYTAIQTNSFGVNFCSSREIPITKMNYWKSTADIFVDTLCTDEWTKMEYSYTANGTEEYIFFGDFSPDELIINYDGIEGCLYVFIDDIKLVKSP